MYTLTFKYSAFKLPLTLYLSRIADLSVYEFYEMTKLFVKPSSSFCAYAVVACLLLFCKIFSDNNLYYICDYTTQHTAIWSFV